MIRNSRLIALIIDRLDPRRLGIQDPIAPGALSALTPSQQESHTTHQAGIRRFSLESYSVEFGVYLYVGANVMGASSKLRSLKAWLPRISLRS
jgi:hypothetical protein